MTTLADQLETIMPTRLTGRVVRTVGMTVAVGGFPAPVGATVEIDREAGNTVRGEVVGFRDDQTLVYPLSSLTGVRRGNRVRLVRTSRFLRVGDQLLGRVIDAHGNTIDGKPVPILNHRVSLDRDPPLSVERPRIDKRLSTGIRAIDALITCGRGQRMGIFSGSGVGKSVLIGMMARYCSADVIVIGLIGERGREVNDFIERDLGPEGLAKSVVVVATSNEPALVRVRAAMAATAVAEHFRDSGKDVLLLMDSITRCAMAQREIGLAAGEPPTTRGYPPSMFSLLPRLVERAGTSPQGTITAFYSVLVEGDDTNEPVSDTVRGLLDGHTLLSRDLAARHHYPAIDVLGSLSRVMPDITPQDHRDSAAIVRRLMAAYRDHEDLISIGAYRQGTNPTVDLAIAMRESIDTFLTQQIDERSDVESAKQQLLELVRQCAAQNQAQKPQNTSPTGGPGIPP